MMLSFFVRLSPRPPPPIRYPFPLIGSFDPISADLIRSFELFFAARFAISINRCVSHTTIFLGTYLCGLARAYRSLPSVRKPARNRVQPSVYRPTLDGSAERKANLRPDLSLKEHGAEIANLLFYEDLSDVVLVGTSIGGMVACQAAELAPDRVRRLVFIDALVPLPGESVSTTTAPTGGGRHGEGRSIQSQVLILPDGFSCQGSGSELHQPYGSVLRPRY